MSRIFLGIFLSLLVFTTIGCNDVHLKYNEVLYSLPIPMKLSISSKDKYSADVVKLKCEVPSDPEIGLFYWEKDGRPISMNRGNYKLHECYRNFGRHEIPGSANVLELIISDIGRKQYGEYTCVATNKIGTLKGTITFSGNERGETHQPFLHNHSSPSVYHEQVSGLDASFVFDNDESSDHNVTLTCLGFDRIIGIASWEKVGEDWELTYLTNHTFRRSRSGFETKLEIRKFQEADYGTYTCAAMRSFKRVIELKPEENLSIKSERSWFKNAQRHSLKIRLPKCHQESIYDD